MTLATIQVLKNRIKRRNRRVPLINSNNHQLKLARINNREMIIFGLVRTNSNEQLITKGLVINLLVGSLKTTGI